MATVTVFKGSDSGKIVKDAQPQKESLKENEVAIRITHSGVCATDLHFLSYPMVLGHEGVGVVERVGSNVTKFKVGDRAGFGYAHGGCGKCESCVSGYAYRCTVSPRNYGGADFDQGSFSSQAVWNQQDLAKIPDGMDSADAAPFMCAGATVFVPMIRHGVKKGDRVGLVGFGGLGHLAIQFAAKLGAEVVVFTRSDDKKQEALNLGATEFYSDLSKQKPERGIDHLFVMTGKHPDWPIYLSLMNAFGKVYPLEIDFSPIVIPFQTFLDNELRFCGECTKTEEEMQSTLDFAAKHNIKPILQKFPFTQSGVEEALDKLRKGTMRYRGVLVA